MRIIALPFTVYNGEAPTEAVGVKKYDMLLNSFANTTGSILRLGISGIVIPEYTIMVMSS